MRQMMNNYCVPCGKGMLTTINVFSILIAMLLFGYAVVDSRIIRKYDEEHGAGTFAGDVMIAIACLVFVGIALFCCVGVVRENVKMLYLYSGMIIFLILVEMLFAFYVSVQRIGLDIRVTAWIRDEFYANVTEEKQFDHDKMWDDIQIDYECCGLNGPEDYTALQRSISVSCCPGAYNAKNDRAKHQLYQACIESQSYTKAGCEDEVLYKLREETDCLLGLALFSFCLESMGVLLALLIANRLKNSVQAYKYTVKY